jgi:phage-related protein
MSAGFVKDNKSFNGKIILGKSQIILSLMPQIKIIFYQDEKGTIPILEWLDKLPSKVQTKCFIKLERLSQLGHELRRPEADLLRDKIYELRIGFQGINYRVLYFFSQNQAVIISHGIIKEKQVPTSEIEQAIKNKTKFEHNPQLHTYSQELI